MRGVVTPPKRAKKARRFFYKISMKMTNPVLARVPVQLNALKKKLPSSFKARIEWLVVFLLMILLIIVVPISVANQIAGHQALASQSVSGNSSALNVATNSAFFIDTTVFVTVFSPLLNQVVVNYQFTRVNDQKINGLYRPVLFTTNGVSTSMPRTMSTAQQTVTYTLSDSDASQNLYPFDTQVLASSFNIFDQTTNLTAPLNVVLGGSLDTFSISYDFAGTKNPNFDADGVNFKFMFTRSITTKVFSMGIVFLMWSLALSITWLSITLWLRNRTVEPPTISVAAALLFALPPLRAAQSGIPFQGCALDIGSFVYCMILIALSLVLLMWNYILKKKAEPSAGEPSVKDDSSSTATGSVF